MSPKSLVENRIREIRRNTRRKYSAEEKVRIVIEGLRGEDSIAALCRKEGINQNLYYRWSKDFLEAGKKRMKGDIEREANSSEVSDLRKENHHLKQLVADISLKNDTLKKSSRGHDVKHLLQIYLAALLHIQRHTNSKGRNYSHLTCIDHRLM